MTVTCDVLPVSGNPAARIISIAPHVAVVLHHTCPTTSTGRKVFLALTAATGRSPKTGCLSNLLGTLEAGQEHFPCTDRSNRCTDRSNRQESVPGTDRSNSGSWSGSSSRNTSVPRTPVSRPKRGFPVSSRSICRTPWTRGFFNRTGCIYLLFCWLYILVVLFSSFL